MQELPAMAGIELANWNWKVVHQFVLGAVRHRPEPQWLPELPAPSGVCLQAPEEASAQG